MSEERRRRQRQRAELGVRTWLRKAWRWLLSVLTAATIFDWIKDLAKSQVSEWAMPILGPYGRWLIGNPFSLLTIAVVGILFWIIKIFLEGFFIKREQAGFQPVQKSSRTRSDSNFAFGGVVVAVFAISAVIYGSYHYYTTPLPAYIRVSSSWFDVHYKGADLWVTVNVQNFSDQVLDATGEMEATAFNQPILRDTNDPSTGDADKGTKILPWKQSYQHVLFTFDPELSRAYEADAIVVTRKVHYQVGQTKYVYHYTGRVMHGTKKCWACAGSLEFVEDGWAPDPFVQRSQK